MILTRRQWETIVYQMYFDCAETCFDIVTLIEEGFLHKEMDEPVLVEGLTPQEKAVILDYVYDRNGNLRI